MNSNCKTCPPHADNKEILPSESKCPEYLSKINKKKGVERSNAKMTKEFDERSCRTGDVSAVKDSFDDSWEIVGGCEETEVTFDTSREYAEGEDLKNEWQLVDVDTLNISEKECGDKHYRCSEHEKELTLWCKDCRALACIKCTSTTHVKHSLIDINDSQAGIRESVNTAATEMGNLSKELGRKTQELIEHMENMLKDESDINECLQDLTAITDKLYHLAKDIKQLGCSIDLKTETFPRFELMKLEKQCRAEEEAFEIYLNKKWRKIEEELQTDEEYQVSR